MFNLLRTLLVLSSIIPSALSANADTQTLNVRLHSDIRSTDPGINRDGDTDAVVLHIVEGLVAYREDTSVGLMLARSLDVSPDGLTYTFRLREGVKFHDGTSLRAEDVRLAWSRYMDAKMGWRCRPDFSPGGIAPVSAVEAPDPSTVVFRLARPSALFLVTMARPDCGSTAIYARSSLNSDGTWKAPVGTGPFRLGAWRRGEYIELERNESYAALPGERDGHTGNKTPQVDKVRFIVVPDDAIAKAGLLTGKIDLLWTISAADADQYRSVPEVRTAFAPTMELYALLLQANDPLLKDVRIRRAIALALDVGQIAESVLPGTKGSRSVIPTPSSFYGSTQAAIPPRDLPAARSLLVEAGYRGQPIKLITTKSYQRLFKVAVYIQAQAAEAGINFELEVLDWASELDRYTKGNYQAMAFNYAARLDPTVSFDMISGPKATEPRKVWDNPEVQVLISRSAEEIDKTRRQAIFNELETRLRLDVPMVNLFSSVEPSASRANVHGYKGWALNQPRAWGVRKAGL